MNMEELNEVWKFVEEKINCAVPAYFKNILKACGYDNVITIASIEEKDVQYFEEEVKNGKVAKYYEESGTIKILDGSTKTETNFEFTRGHKKLLLFISDYLKNYLKDNDPNTSILPLRWASKKSSSLALANSVSKSVSQMSHNNLPSKHQNNTTDREAKLQQGILTCEIIMSLINTTPALFVANMVEINNKFAHVQELFKMKTSNKLFEATIYCPVCSKPTTAIQKWSNEFKLKWNMSNFVDHLTNTHLSYEEQIDNKPILTQVKDLSKGDFAHHVNANIKDKEFMKGCTETSEPHESLLNDSTDLADKFTGLENLQFSVQFPHIVEHDDTKDHSYSHILKEGIASPNSMNSQCLYVSGTDEKLQSILPVTSPQLGNYVVCSLFVKDTVKWPSNKNIRKNFVGKICEMKKDIPIDGHVGERNEMFNIQFLIKKRHSSFIFFYPDEVEITCISRNKIVKILPDPVQNRRGGLVFKDKSMLNYDF